MRISVQVEVGKGLLDCLRVLLEVWVLPFTKKLARGVHRVHANTGSPVVDRQESELGVTSLGERWSAELFERRRTP